jgi:hypothetical protein
MPKAARARVASPPAGTALARAIRDCLPDRVQLGRDSEVYVSNTVTNVNNTVTEKLCPGLREVRRVLPSFSNIGIMCGAK